MLETARDEVDIKAALYEERREERVTRGTLDLVAKLGVGAEYGYARFTAHGSSLDSVLVTALGDQALMELYEKLKRLRSMAIR